MKKLLLLPLVFLLAGCWDTHQSERMYYILGLGLDYEDDQYTIYAQIIDFSNIAKSEQPNPEATQVEIGKVTGLTLDDAFFNLYQSMDERLFLGHLGYVIFSENLAKANKIPVIVNSFIRYRELRYTTWAYVTETPIEDVMLTTPIINKSITLSKLSDPLNSYNQSSRVRPIPFRELMIQLDEPSHEAKIPFVEVSEEWSTDKGLDKVHTFVGVSVIDKQNGLKGKLLEKDALGIQWLTTKTQRSNVTIPFTNYEEPYVTITVDQVKPEIKAIVSENPLQFDIEVKLLVQPDEFRNEQQAKKMKQAIEKQVQKEIEETFLTAVKQDIDIYRLSEVVYRKHHKVWKKYEQDGKIPLDENSLRNVQVELVKVKGERITSN